MKSQERLTDTHHNIITPLQDPTQSPAELNPASDHEASHRPESPRDAEIEESSKSSSRRLGKHPPITTTACIDHNFYSDLKVDLDLIHYADLFGSERRSDRSMKFRPRMREFPDAERITGKDLPRVLNAADRVAAFWGSNREGMNRIGRRSLQTIDGPLRDHLDVFERYRYMQSQLESLKTMLVDFERQIVEFHNQIKTADRIANSADLTQTACNCISSLITRRTLTFVEGIFELEQNNTDSAVKEGEDIAKVAASFCFDHFIGAISDILVNIKNLMAPEENFAISRHIPSDLRGFLQRLHSNRVKRSILDSDASNGFSSPFDEATNYADLDILDQGSSDEVIRRKATNRQLLAAIIRITQTLASRQDSSGRIIDLDHRSKREASIEKRTQRKVTTVKSSKSKKNETTKPVDPWVKKLNLMLNKCAIDGIENAANVASDLKANLYPKSWFNARSDYWMNLQDSIMKKFKKEWNASISAHKDRLSKFDTPPKDSPSMRTISEGAERRYKSGFSLGFHVGYYVGLKAKSNWPEPLELNTFLWDILLDGDEDLSNRNKKPIELEWNIVVETMKRLAFVQSNKRAFETALRIGLVNGAILKQSWGLHTTERAAAKKAADDSSKIGYLAGLEEARKFQPRAVHFFEFHDKKQNAKTKKKPIFEDKTINATKGIAGDHKLIYVDDPNFESILEDRLKQVSGECGQKAGTVMGATVGLYAVYHGASMVEQNEGITYRQLLNEIVDYEKGAIRGFELGEKWATTSELQDKISGQHKSAPSLLSLDIEEEKFDENIKSSKTILDYLMKSYPISKISGITHEKGAKFKNIGTCKRDLYKKMMEADEMRLEKITLDDLYMAIVANGYLPSDLPLDFQAEWEDERVHLE